jgi:hypothetical protein
MAGNKYNPPSRPHKPMSYTLQYANAHGVLETLQGTARQIIMHILNQQTIKYNIYDRQRNG